MSRNNAGINVLNRDDQVPTDAQGGYAGGDSTAAQLAGIADRALAALTTMEGLKVSAKTLPAGSTPTASMSGAVPSRTITLGIPAGRDGMGYAEGQQLVASAQSAATNTAAAIRDNLAADINNTQGPAYQALVDVAGGISDPQVASTVTNLESQTRQALRTILDAYNVRDFGAKGDGVADDRAAIQACFDAAKAAGMMVRFPAGTYRVTGSLYPLKLYTGKVRIYGAGDASTILADTTDGTLLAVSGGVTIYTLRVDGGFDPASKTANYYSTVNLGDDCTIMGCTITRAQGSCVTPVGKRMTVTGCTLDKFGDHAVYCAQGLAATAPYTPNGLCSDIIVTGNTITDDPTFHNVSGDPVRGAIKFRGNVERVTISNNTVYGDQCVILDADWRRAEACPRGILITGNSFRSSHSGVALYTMTYTGATDSGARVKDVTITGNSFTSATGAGDYGVLSTRSQATISGNTFACGSHAVYGHATIDSGPILVTGNNIRLGTSGGCSLLGTGSVISGNLFTGTGSYATWLTYRNTVRGNTFQGVGVGVQMAHLPSSVAEVSIIAGNEFRGCTTGVFHTDVAGVYSRLTDNLFSGATTSVRVYYGADFNKGQSSGNRVLSGAALPTVGVRDSVALTAPTSSWP